MVKNPQLGDLNPKNPYLRSSDPSLIVQVMLTKMNATSTADLLAAQDLGDHYTVSRGVGGINGFLVDITGKGETPEKSMATTLALGKTPAAVPLRCPEGQWGRRCLPLFLHRGGHP